jgi:hypothetical protein
MAALLPYMAQQVTADGLTVDDIESAYEVLEVLRESFSEDDMFDFAQIANEAHYLVQQYEKDAAWHESFNVPEVGDVVHDTDHVEKFGDGDVRVTEVLNVPAKLHYIDVRTGKRSVAYENPEFSPNAPVVKGQYVDGSAKEYAFPADRLE